MSIITRGYGPRAGLIVTRGYGSLRRRICGKLKIILSLDKDITVSPSLDKEITIEPGIEKITVIPEIHNKAKVIVRKDRKITIQISEC